MHRTQLIVATLLLALLAPAGREGRATGSNAAIVFEWNQILQSRGLPDVSHQFEGFWQAAEEQTESRIDGGIHYRFDHVAVTRSAGRPPSSCSPTS